MSWLRSPIIESLIVSGMFAICSSALSSPSFFSDASFSSDPDLRSILTIGDLIRWRSVCSSLLKSKLAFLVELVSLDTTGCYMSVAESESTTWSLSSP